MIISSYQTLTPVHLMYILDFQIAVQNLEHRNTEKLFKLTYKNFTIVSFQPVPNYKITDCESEGSS